MDNPTKQAAGLKSIDVEGFTLVPVGQYILDDTELLGRLAHWRNTYVAAYPTRFTATVESTRVWLQNLILQSSRLLFMVNDSQGYIVGHLGLAGIDSTTHTLEIDNVVRWSDQLPPNTFSRCLQSLVDWAHSTMYIEELTLCVFSSNLRAINFYQKKLFRQAQYLFHDTP